MAMFDLRCKDCDEEFTKIVSYEDLGDVKCPKCDSTNHERIYKLTAKGPVASNQGSGLKLPTSGFT